MVEQIQASDGPMESRSESSKEVLSEAKPKATEASEAKDHLRPTNQESLDQASHEVKMFMSTLHQIEQTGNVDLMANLFSDVCVLWRQAFLEPHEGLAGARRFWKEYLDQFEAIHSRFLQVTEVQGLYLLEWDSKGQLKGGRPIHYTGVSIIQMDADRKVHSFKTYFDSANFILAQHGSHHLM